MHIVLNQTAVVNWTVHVAHQQKIFGCYLVSAIGDVTWNIQP